MRPFIFSLIFIVQCCSYAQNTTYTEQEISISPWIEGTLMVPPNVKNPYLAIIIAGSGPTNRDGNQNFMKNNALKKLAEALYENDIATFRYDKRVVKQLRLGKFDDSTSFDDFVEDAKKVVNYFNAQDAFGKIIIIGHSQGSLVGMLAGKTRVDGFISLAGAGQNIGDVLIEQIAKTAPALAEDSKKVIASLKAGKTTTNFPQALSSLFNADLQPFMMSWMKYEPTEIMKQLDMPVLVVNGTKDLQVSVEEAELLSKANPKSNLAIIQLMNHVLVDIEGDDLENSKSYNEASRPISESLIQHISTFIKTL